MPRPTHRKLVSERLEERVFKPLGVPMSRLEEVDLTLDGLEAMRLADIEGLYQEAAAERMGISRATFARVLAAARTAVAEALVDGKALSIRGGRIDRRPAGEWPCPVHGGTRRHGRGCRCGNGSGQATGSAPTRRAGDGKGTEGAQSEPDRSENEEQKPGRKGRRERRHENRHHDGGRRSRLGDK